LKANIIAIVYYSGLTIGGDGLGGAISWNVPYIYDSGVCEDYPIDIGDSFFLLNSAHGGSGWDHYVRLRE